MIRIKKIFVLAFIIFVNNYSFAADTHIVKMLNNGKDGAMVFEPAYIKINKGDSITFEMEDKGHNAVTILGPDGSKPFDTQFAPTTTVQFDKSGLYFYQCTPHAIMAMAGIIQVDNTVNKDEIKLAIDKFEGTVMVPNVKKRMSDLFNNNVK